MNKAKSKRGACDVCDAKSILNNGLCSKCAKSWDPYLDQVIDKYFSDAKKGILSLKGALYIEDSWVVKFATDKEDAKIASKTKYIEKILRALGTTKSINLFHPLMRWAYKLHPKQADFRLEIGRYAYKRRSPAEKKAYSESYYSGYTNIRSEESKRDAKFWHPDDDGVDYRTNSGNNKLDHPGFIPGRRTAPGVVYWRRYDGEILAKLQMKGLYRSAIKSLSKLDYQKGYPELLEMFLLPSETYDKIVLGRLKDDSAPLLSTNLDPRRGKADRNRYHGLISYDEKSWTDLEGFKRFHKPLPQNLLAAEVLTAIGGTETVDILSDIASSTPEKSSEKYLAHLRRKIGAERVSLHYGGVRNFATIALSKIKNKGSGTNRKITNRKITNRKTISTLLKRLESKDLPTRRHAAIALMDAMDEPDLEILWKVTREFLEWERERAKYLKKQYGGEYR